MGIDRDYSGTLRVDQSLDFARDDLTRPQTDQMGICSGDPIVQFSKDHFGQS